MRDLPPSTVAMVHFGWMIAEFAKYHSWIAWVPIVGLLAVPLAFRRVLAVSLAFVGAFVGLIVICLTMPLGTNAEQLGANVAAGLGIGAAVGAVIGLALDAARAGRPPRDASVYVVGFAIGVGTLGALIGGFGPSVIAGTPPDLEVSVVAAVAIGGGIGWAIGGAYGWSRARNARTPDTVQRWILLVAALSVALFGAAIVATIASGSFGPPVDSMTRAERHALPLVSALYSVDVALVVSTFIGAAARGAEGLARTAVPDAVESV